MKTETFFLKAFAENVAVIDGDTDLCLTYAELERRIDELSENLSSQQSLFFLFCQNSIHDLVIYLAALNKGHAICLLDASMPSSFKHHLINHYRPHYIFEHQQIHYSHYNPIELAWHDMIAYRRNDFTSPTLHPELALLLSTSGTTGNPKLIRLSRKNIQSNAYSIIKYLAIGTGERAIAHLPMHYSYGLSVINSHLLAGGSLVLTSQSVMQKRFWDTFQKHQCTSFSGVPYHYHLLNRLNIEQFHLPTLKTMTQAGGRLDKDLVLRFHQYMQLKYGNFYVMYGQTEATARISYLPPSLLPEKIGAIGIPIPDGALKIFDNNTEIVTPKQIGELVYEGDNVMMGYALTAEDLSKGDEMQGRLKTGDLGYFDEDSIFYLTGRLNRISKVYGLRINLDDIETQLSSEGPVAVTSDDEFIFLYFENITLDIAEKNIKKLAESYKIHPSTFQYRQVQSLPRTSSGKIDYKQLQGMS